MSLETIEPHADYDMLVRQFRALKGLALSLQAQLRVYQNEKWQERIARNDIDGERAINAALTEEIEVLNAKLALYELKKR